MSALFHESLTHAVMTFVYLVALVFLCDMTAYAVDSRTGTENLRISLVFNNVPYTPGLKTGWGFAAVIERRDKTVLFDTGGDGTILLSNMEHLGIDPKAVNAIVLSHIHGDHTGGLQKFLERNPDVTVYIPESFPASFKQAALHQGAKIKTVTGPSRLLDSIHSTGEMGKAIKEQALIVESKKGLVIITGCGHPGVAKIAAAAKEYLQKEIYLLMGGFHLSGKNDTEVHTIIGKLKALGIKKVAPSHCTGDDAIALFRETWGDSFIESGCGNKIEIPLQAEP